MPSYYSALVFLLVVSYGGKSCIFIGFISWLLFKFAFYRNSYLPGTLDKACVFFATCSLDEVGLALYL